MARNSALASSSLWSCSSTKIPESNRAMSPWFFGQKRLQRELGAGVPLLLRFPETVNERSIASCRRRPRRAVAVEAIEKGEGKPFDHGRNLATEGQTGRPRRRKHRSRAA